ncbi:unnamed protein product [Sphagnum jensenii]|uniref:Uncharacterized protein n=1 Tax=Sphagnum jensenii TaxID=128206 RepID=A0ABP1ALC1_9BRYO
MRGRRTQHMTQLRTRRRRSSQTGYRTWVPWAFRCHLYDREVKSIGQQLSAHGRKIKKIVETRDVAKWTFGKWSQKGGHPRKENANELWWKGQAVVPESTGDGWRIMTRVKKRVRILMASS